MKARTAIAWTAHRVRLTTVGWGFTTVLACVALSACTSSSTPPAVFTPAVTGTSTVSPSTSSTASPDASPSASASPSPSASPSSSPSPEPSTSLSPSPVVTTSFPTVAPVTGGGGTAGFQDAGLAVLGGTAIAAGLGSIAYRRRMTRNR
jgi:hypothetical protein